MRFRHKLAYVALGVILSIVVTGCGEEETTRTKNKDDEPQTTVQEPRIETYDAGVFLLEYDPSVWVKAGSDFIVTLTHNDTGGRIVFSATKERGWSMDIEKTRLARSRANYAQIPGVTFWRIGKSSFQGVLFEWLDAGVVKESVLLLALIPVEGAGGFYQIYRFEVTHIASQFSRFSPAATVLLRDSVTWVRGPFVK